MCDGPFPFLTSDMKDSLKSMVEFPVLLRLQLAKYSVGTGYSTTQLIDLPGIQMDPVSFPGSIISEKAAVPRQVTLTAMPH